MKYLRIVVGLALVALVSAFIVNATHAQGVTAQPGYIENGAVNDFGNGPVEIKILSGNASVAAAVASGTLSSTTATVLTLTGTPTLPPCVGCAIGTNAGATTTTVVSSSGNTITITATLGALTNGTTLIGWGIPCTASPPAGVRAAQIQPGQPGGSDYPFYSLGRICGYAPNGPGAMILTFPIGAH
jgi:hypothetical protein